MFEAMNVQPGAKLRLKDGSIVEVTENPRDGLWLFCRHLSAPDGGPVGEGEQAVLSDEVAQLVE